MSTRIDSGMSAGDPTSTVHSAVHLALVNAKQAAKKRNGPLRCFAALSGGEDSHVLLHALLALSSDHNMEVAIAHLNRRAGENADKHEAFVRSLAKRYSRPLVVHKSRSARPQAVEDEIWEERLRFFSRIRNSYGADFVVLGHHLHDRIEALLFDRLVAGTRAGGKSAALPGCEQLDLSKRILQPLLDLPRTALEDYSIAHNLSFLTFPQPDFATDARAIFRHQVLPCLLQSADVQQLAGKLGAIEQLLSTSTAVANEALLPAVRKPARAAADLGRAGARCSRPLDVSGIVISRYDDGSLAALEARELCPAEIPPAALEHGYVEHGGNPRSIARAYFDTSSLAWPLEVRELRDGDLVRTETGAPITLEELYAQAGFEPSEFSRFPLVASREEIIWVPGIYRSPVGEITAATSMAVELCYRRRERRQRPLFADAAADRQAQQSTR